MLKSLSINLEKQSNIAINNLTKVYGLNTDIYYPKSDTESFTTDNAYSGRYDSVVYDSYPTITGKYVFPDIFEERRNTYGSGLTDVLFKDTFTMYSKLNDKIPLFSKVVVTTSTGPMSFIVENSINDGGTEYSELYNKYELSPFLSYSPEISDESFKDDLDNSYTDVVISDDYNDDNSVNHKSNISNSKYSYSGIMINNKD